MCDDTTAARQVLVGNKNSLDASLEEEEEEEEEEVALAYPG